MKSGTEKVVPQLPCPQCHELMPSDGKYCISCGAELHAECPDCGTRRGAEDSFCRKCGFNFSRKKLRLRNPPSATDSEASERAAPALGDIPPPPLPLVGFHKPGKRYEYRMSPLMGAIRAFFMLVFLLLVAAGVFWAFNWAWGNVSGKSLLELFRRVTFAGTEHTASSEKAAEPDWNVRYQYWLGYYRDVFAPPPTNTWVEVGLNTGIRENGTLVQVTDDRVILKKDGKELGYPRVLLDTRTRQVFFPDDYASANAKARVNAERAEWQPQARPSSTSSGNFAVLQGSQASGATSNAPPAARTFLDIKCPVCGGMGFVIEAGGGGQRGAGGLSIGVIGRTGSGSAPQKGAMEKPKTGKQTVKQSCPVCNGKGFRRFDRPPDFPWPAGASRCGECHGMGVLRSRSDQGGFITSVCPMCDRRGYVVNQWDASRNVPPKYE